MGGGMRQCGYLAAAGIYALDHHVERLKTDHERARSSANKLASLSWVAEILPVKTNIVIFRVADHLTAKDVEMALKAKNILCVAINEQFVRWVFHLDISDEMTTLIENLTDDLF